MSLYSELVDRVSKGAKYKINLVEKTLKIDGKEIVLEGNLIDENDTLGVEPWEALERLYFNYKRSIPSTHHNGNKPYFKADSVEDLDDVEMAFNEPRNQAQFSLEAYVLFAGLSGWLKFENDKHWFWQSSNFDGLVVLKEWI